MSNENRKVLAVAAGAAMTLSTLVGVLPANAVDASQVTVEPSSGDSYGVFATDTLSLDLARPQLMAESVANANFALLVQNPDGESLDVEFANGSSNITYSVVYVDALGDTFIDSSESYVSDAGVVTESSLDTVRAFDFPDSAAGEAATSIIFHSFKGAAAAALMPTGVEIASTSGAFGDDQFSLTLTGWVDGDADLGTVDAANASTSATATFYDPADANAIVKLQREKDSGGTIRLNSAGDTGMYGTLKFSKPVNLDQVDLSHWDFNVINTDSVGSATTNAGVDVTRDIVRGYDDSDDAGAILIEFPVSGTTLRAGSGIQISTAADAADARSFSSNRFDAVQASDTDVDGADLDVTETANAVEGSSANTVDVRNGTATVNYTVQIKNGAVDLEVANQPVIVVATATEGTVSVAGSADGVVDENTVIWNTTTDSDGQVDVAVTSSALEGDSYTLDAFGIESDGTSYAATRLTATYDAGALAELDTDADVYTGETVSIALTLDDNFDQPISVDGDGDTVRVTAVASDSDNLEQTVTIVDGEAVITFDNYLSAGESDIITIDPHTGPYDDQISALSSLTGDQLTVTLYADVAVSGITVTNDEITTKVGYTPFSDDPILDGGDPSLASANDGVISGTVVDSSGAGIPGAQVTMTAAGVQFANNPTFVSNVTTDGTFAVDSITVTATESGTFEVNAWSHVADDVVVTITSGAQSATVTLEGELDTTIDAGDLVVSWNLQENLVYNTTYAVTGTLTDVWGNGLDDAQLVFRGEAAAQFNSATSVTKTTNASGQATAYLRSLEDVSGLSAVSLEVSGDINRTLSNLTSTSITDDEDTPWDESSWNDEISEEITFLTSAPAASSDTKVNAGSFKGYVAVYAKGYEGQRLSAKIGNDWVIVPSLASSFERIVDFTGAGVEIAVRIYIDRVLMDTINLTTK